MRSKNELDLRVHTYDRNKLCNGLGKVSLSCHPDHFRQNFASQRRHNFIMYEGVRIARHSKWDILLFICTPRVEGTTPTLLCSDTTTLEKVISTPQCVTKILIPNPRCLDILCYCTDSSTPFCKYRDSNTFLKAKSVSNTPPKLSIPLSNR